MTSSPTLDEKYKYIKNYLTINKFSITESDLTNKTIPYIYNILWAGYFTFDELHPKVAIFYKYVSIYYEVNNNLIEALKYYKLAKFRNDRKYYF